MDPSTTVAVDCSASETMANSEETVDTESVTESQPDNECTLLLSKPVENPHGQLCGKDVLMQSLDLHDGVLTVGRDPQCGLSLNTAHMPEKLSHLSKVHFSIEKQEDDCDAPVYITDKSLNGTFLNGNLIGRNRQRILKTGDVISVCLAELEAFVYKELRLNSATRLLALDLPMNYYIGRMLGSGAYGVVYLLYNTETCQPFALKQVAENRMTEQLRRPRPLNDPARVMNEINIMENIDHPCVIRMHDIIDKPNSLYMVLEYMKGDDLLSRILAKNGLPEKTSKMFLCHAVKYLYNQEITHRDLKPANMLLADEEEYTLLKVSDFGLSRFVDKNYVMRTLCGTPMYVAPEVLLTLGTGSYTAKVDIWSLGVVLYNMLSGTMPFLDDPGTPPDGALRLGDHVRIAHPSASEHGIDRWTFIRVHVQNFEDEHRCS